MMDIYYRGAFGQRAATVAASLCGQARLIDIEDIDQSKLAMPARGGRAMVLLSDASGTGLSRLATAFREAAVTWTAVNLYPAMIRIGPLVRAEGVCFDCATRRYLASPGSPGLARLEKLLRGAAAESIELPVVPGTVVVMAVAEALRQLEDQQVPAGFIRKVDFVDHNMSAAVASSLHGCRCCGQEDVRAHGKRFYLDLEDDMRLVIGAGSQ